MRGNDWVLLALVAASYNPVSGRPLVNPIRSKGLILYNEKRAPAPDPAGYTLVPLANDIGSRDLVLHNEKRSPAVDPNPWKVGKKNIDDVA
jgi:hypothetical protein